MLLQPSEMTHWFCMSVLDCNVKLRSCEDISTLDYRYCHLQALTLHKQQKNLNKWRALNAALFLNFWMLILLYPGVFSCLVSGSFSFSESHTWVLLFVILVLLSCSFCSDALIHYNLLNAQMVLICHALVHSHGGNCSRIFFLKLCSCHQSSFLSHCII